MLLLFYLRLNELKIFIIKAFFLNIQNVKNVAI